jgi:hypothetical protein
MAQARRATRSAGLARWLLPASLLHAAGALLVAALSPWAGPAQERATPQPSAAESESSVELVLLDDEAESRAPRVVPPPFGASPPSASVEQRSARAALDVRRPDAAGAGNEPSPSPEPASLAIVDGATAAPPTGDEPPASTASNAPPHAEAPTLSLDQLGIGANPFLAVAVEPLTREQRANARLQAAMQAPSLERDRQLGLGPAGPVVEAARSLVLSDDGLVETSAVFNVRVDGAGHVTEVHVLEASSHVKTWQLIAARLAQALDPEKLRAASPKADWGMQLRLASSVRLPSGAAPGMRMRVLGQQVAGSGGPGSTSLELSPTSKLDLKEPIDSVGRHLDPTIIAEVMLLKLRADPTDIGAAARRVVEVAVLSIDEPAAP